MDRSGWRPSNGKEFGHHCRQRPSWASVTHVDLMGVSSEQEVTERFRWAWQFFVQQAVGGFWRGVLPELSATIPGTSVAVKIGGSVSKSDPVSWGDVVVSFDKETTKTGGLLFVDEMQD